MTPQEKALELYSKVYGQTPTRMDELQIEEDKRFSKQCALIAVDEIIAHIEPSISIEILKTRIEYFNEVKQEIEKL